MYEQMFIPNVRKPYKNPFVMDEQELMNWCIHYINSKGHFAQRINSGKAHRTNLRTGRQYWIKMADRGTPDVVGHTKQGQALYIECKIKPNKPTFEQLQFIQMAKDMGCLAEVIYSQEELMEIL